MVASQQDDQQENRWFEKTAANLIWIFQKKQAYDFPRSWAGVEGHGPSVTPDLVFQEGWEG